MSIPRSDQAIRQSAYFSGRTRESSSLAFLFFRDVPFCQLTAEKDAAVSRTELAGSELMVAAKDLDAGRQELDAFRRATFESYVAQHPPPPNYEVATNPIPTSENTSEAQSDPPIVQDEDGVDQFFQSLTTTDNSTTQPIQPQPPLTWGSSKFSVLRDTDQSVKFDLLRKSICLRNI